MKEKKRDLDLIEEGPGKFCLILFSCIGIRAKFSLKGKKGHYIKVKIKKIEYHRGGSFSFKGFASDSSEVKGFYCPNDKKKGYLEFVRLEDDK